MDNWQTRAAPAQVEIARHLRVTKGRVTQLKGAGMPVDSFEAAETWYRANIDPRWGHGPDAPLPKRSGSRAVESAYDAIEARAKREHHEAEIAEMKARQLAGELVNAQVVARHLTDASAQMRLALERIPDRIAPQVAALTDEAAIHSLIDAEIAAVLVDLTARIESHLQGPG